MRALIYDKIEVNRCSFCILVCDICMLVEGVLYNAIDYDTVAAYQYIGENPEEKVGDVMDEFVRTNKLYEKKQDARLFGFNHPDLEEGNPVYGYEDWVTIPDDMEVPEPLVKKQFNGGLYAAYIIKFSDFFEWKYLTEWVEKSVYLLSDR